MQQELYYQESGKAPLGGLAAGLVGGGIAAAVLGYVYSYVILYMPIAGYVTFILSGGFGFLMGLVTSLALRSGKVRSSGKAAVVGSVVALFGFYVGWAVWIYALLRRNDVELALSDLVFSPAVLWDIIGKVNEEGAWTMKGFTPTGGVLWFLWALEAALILGPAIFLAANSVDVFCETCDQWCETHAAAAIVPTASQSEVTSWSEQKNFAGFERLGALPAGVNEFLKLDLNSCAKCNTMHTLDVNHVVITKNSKNEDVTTATAWVSKLLVSAADVARIRKLGKSDSPSSHAAASAP